VVEWRPDDHDVYLTRGEDNLALHVPRASREPPAGNADSALDHFGLLVDRAEDVHAWASYLEGRGVDLDTRPRTHRDGATSFYVRDPDGNRVQFIHHPPIAGR